MQRKQEKFLHAYKAARFVDRKDIKKIIPHFMQRNYGMSLVWMIAAFLCGGSATYALLYMTSNMALIGLVFCSIFCCLAVFCVINVKHSRDLLMATEFQNAIFSAAARIDCKFSLIIDAEGRTLYMDSAFQHIFSRELTLGYEGIKALLAHEGLRENEKALVAEAIEKKQSFTVPFYMKEDEKEVSFSLFVDPLDRPVGFSFIRCMNYNNDAKEKRVSSVTPSPHASAQNNLTTLIAEKEWEHLLDMAPVAVALLTKEGEVLWSNQAFLTLASEEKPSGWNAHHIIDEDREGAFQALLQEALDSEKAALKSFEMKMRRNKEVTTSWYLRKMEDQSHTTSCVIACVMDSTEQKNLELRFVHSQKMQAVGQLAGGIAHDFNNLLTAMIGFCDLLLLKHPAGDPSFSDIMQIKQNANRAAGLVRQLLAFSRKQTLQPEILDLADVLAEISNLIRRLIGENIELNIIHGRDLHFVKVDQGQLEQVIINLAVNARDAMLNGGILTIRTDNVVVDKAHPLPPDFIPPTDEDGIIDGNYVLIEVTDTGCGMSRAVIEKIFEPFFSTKEVGSGTGLGLSTVYGIVKQTDGYIYVKSSEGKGASFSIFLKTTEGEKTRKESEDKLPLQDLTGKGTILLVEDEAPVRIFSSSALTGKGYHVLEADCAEIALDIIEMHKGQIDLIITDVIMPGINGPTMIEEVHALYPSIKVIFMSGYAEDALVKAQGDGTSFHFVPKPFTLKQLASKVKEVLGGG